MDREKAYLNHLAEKIRSLQAGLDSLGYGSLCPRVLSVPLEGGFRCRAKFKIFTRDGSPRVCGTDPILGEVSMEQMLWILPAWVHGDVEKLREALFLMRGEFPVDGFEMKLAHGRQEAHLILSVKRGEERNYESMAAELLSRFNKIQGIAIPSQREFFGDEWIRHRIDGREWAAHYSAFFQAHQGLTPKLLREVREISRGLRARRIVDLYCGVGLLSLSFALLNTPVFGVDSHFGAIASAERNAALLGFEQARFLCSLIESKIDSLDIQPEDLVLLDPPRSGCPTAVIRAVAEKRPRGVCLISCNPDTHFRDLSIWGASGYTLRRMSALDMFPFTGYLEMVSLLEKRN